MRFTVCVLLRGCGKLELNERFTDFRLVRKFVTG